MGNNVKMNDEQLKHLGLETSERFLITDTEILKNIESMDQSNIEKIPIKVTDITELQEIKDYRKDNKDELPSGIMSKRMQDSNEKIFDVYYYKSRHHYYKTVYLKESDIEFKLKIKNALSQQSIANSLLFFKVMVIFSITISIIIAIVASN